MYTNCNELLSIVDSLIYLLFFKVKICLNTLNFENLVLIGNPWFFAIKILIMC